MGLLDKGKHKEKDSGDTRRKIEARRKQLVTRVQLFVYRMLYLVCTCIISVQESVNVVTNHLLISDQLVRAECAERVCYKGKNAHCRDH